MSYQFKTEHYEVGAQVRRHGALPAGARVAPGGPAGRPELPELLRRAAGEQVRQGRALGLGRRRAVRRLSLALLPRGRQRRLRRLRREVLRLLAPAGPERGAARASSAPHVWREVSDLRTVDIFREQFPDQRAPESPEEYVNHSLYLEAKTFLHGLFVVEDKLVDGAQPREPRAVPGQRPRRLRAARAGAAEAARPRARRGARREPAEPEDRALLRAHARRQAAAAPGDAALRARARSPTRSSRGSPGPTRAGSAATASTTCARRRARRRLGDVRVPRPDRGARGLSTTISRAARTAGCCCGRC